MPSTRRYAAVTLGIIGFVLATIAPLLVRAWASQVVLAGFSIIGGLLLFIGIIWSERRRQIEGTYDERISEIQFRAGWYAFWIVMTLAFAMMTLTVHTELQPPPWALGVVFFGGFLIYIGTNIGLKRRM